MKESFTIAALFPVSPNKIFDAWLDSEKHSQMTGGKAVVSREIGGTFTAWDGYISGSNIDIENEKKIVQKWRTTEFEESDDDSIITINLKPVDGGTELIIIHENIPEGQTQYEQGWKDHYFSPMMEYFKSH